MENTGAQNPEVPEVAVGAASHASSSSSQAIPQPAPNSSSQKAKRRRRGKKMCRQPVVSPLEDTPLGKLKSVNDKIADSEAHQPDGSVFGKKMKDMVPEPTRECDFCKYACDWGVSNELLFVPAEEASGVCKLCDNSTSLFAIAYKEIVSRKGFTLPPHEDPARQQALLNAPFGSPFPPKDLSARTPSVSKIDGRDTTRFQGIHFCRDCPWRQLDITKVVSCDECRNEKYQIMSHRHESLTSIDALEAAEVKAAKEQRSAAPKHERTLKSRRCMICTSRATDKCDGCPLRVCGECNSALGMMCKGYLDNLFYYYDREHLRNDAFLLRTDLDPKQLIL